MVRLRIVQLESLDYDKPRLFRVGPDLFPYYTQASWRTPVNKINQLIKPEGPGPKVILLSGGYSIYNRWFFSELLFKSTNSYSSF